MIEWSIQPNSLPQITLVADARLTNTSYTNDQIWEFSAHHGEPRGMALETTFGLRARSCRILPRFWLNGEWISDPADFASPVTISAFFPNYLELSFFPFLGLEVNLAYWVSTSQSVAAKIYLKNHTKKNLNLGCDWIVLLSPLDHGERMVISELSGATILSGKSKEIEPVLLLTGDVEPSPGSLPGLRQTIQLKPNHSGSIVAVLASLNHKNASFELARSIANKNWEAEAARIKMVNASRIEILTGDPAWNHIFNLSQIIGASLLISPNEYLPHPTFVLARRPDHGYSVRGDGSDYNHLWNGQTAFHAYYLFTEVLPQFTEIGKGVLENFLFIQSENGFIDWKPGLANQRGKLMATPLLVTFAWTLFEKTGDLEFANRIYLPLKNFFEFWFSTENDTDQDGIPEWKHVFQTGFEDNLQFNCWLDGSKWINISTIESPDLCSMLIKECLSLQRFAEVLNSDDLPDFKKKVDALRAKGEEFWQESTSCYHYRDRDSHLTLVPRILAVQKQATDFLVQQTFDSPVRFLIRLRRSRESPHRVNLFIHGTNPNGDRRIERIAPDQFVWYMEDGYATSEKIYIQVDKIVVEGVHEDDLLTIQTVGHFWIDQTLLLPLWSGFSSKERASTLIEQTILNPQQFFQTCGISCYPTTIAESGNEVQIPYNALILRGLVQYGYYVEAVELFTRLMSALAVQIQREGFFRQTYHPQDGLGKGEKNILTGLAPLGSFLAILGVEIINPWKIKITGRNPFPWPVTVKYSGTTILRKSDITTIVFPDGQSVSVANDIPQTISLV